MKKIIELHPSDVQSRREAEKTIGRLEPLAAEKREKLKEEMIGEHKRRLVSTLFYNDNFPVAGF